MSELLFTAACLLQELVAMINMCHILCVQDLNAVKKTFKIKLVPKLITVYVALGSTMCTLQEENFLLEFKFRYFANGKFAKFKFHLTLDFL